MFRGRRWSFVASFPAAFMRVVCKKIDERTAIVRMDTTTYTSRMIYRGASGLTLVQPPSYRRANGGPLWNESRFPDWGNKLFCTQRGFAWTLYAHFYHSRALKRIYIFFPSREYCTSIYRNGKVKSTIIKTNVAQILDEGNFLRGFLSKILTW